MSNAAGITVLEQLDGVGDELVVQIRDRGPLQVEDEGGLECVLLWWLATAGLPQHLAGAFQYKDDVSLVFLKPIDFIGAHVLFGVVGGGQLWGGDIFAQADGDQGVAVSVLATELDQALCPERVLLKVPGSNLVALGSDPPGDVGLDQVVGLWHVVVGLFEEAKEGDAVVEVGGGGGVSGVLLRVLLLDKVLELGDLLRVLLVQLQQRNSCSLCCVHECVF